MPELDPAGLEAAAKADWMRAHSHAPRFVSPEDLERMWLDWRGLEIDSYLKLLTEKREEVAAYLSVQEQPQGGEIADDREWTLRQDANWAPPLLVAEGPLLTTAHRIGQGVVAEIVVVPKAVVVGDALSVQEQPDEREALRKALAKLADEARHALLSQHATRPPMLNAKWVLDTARAALAVRDTEQQETPQEQWARESNEHQDRHSKWPAPSGEQEVAEAPIVNIAVCPEHGLHGARDTCFECGEPVLQIPMRPVADFPVCEDCGGRGRYPESEYNTRVHKAVGMTCATCHGSGRRFDLPRVRCPIPSAVLAGTCECDLGECTCRALPSGLEGEA
jgi:hypothetical protein